MGWGMMAVGPWWGLVVMVALLGLPALVPAPAPRATDVFVSNCSRIPDTPATNFQYWSNPLTWAPLGISGVPGVGALAGANVTIPCGMAVLLDVTALNLTVLNIRGFLKVYDPPARTNFSVFAALVLVEGQLTIGSAFQHFRSTITFTLVPNPNNRATWKASFVYPAEPDFPRELGHKAFAVMGGQVDLRGMPSGASTPSWVKLNAHLRRGSKQLTVDTDISTSWPLGSRIAVASTDFDSSFTDEFIIVGYGTSPQGTVAFLDRPAQYNHYGDPLGIPDGFGGFIDERAEVALLSRNIIITGLDEPSPYQLEGGHFIVFQTPVPQYIVGVQFLMMGQQGNLGRYSLHFHVCGDTGGQFVVRKNAIVQSKQRCIVVHATHNLTLEGNVAYNTVGHCFMIEEGSEMNNTFLNNLGIRTNAAKVLISLDESDNQPATYWITNMNNNYIGNVAAGSMTHGFWTELRTSVRGMSQSIPGVAGIVPRDTPFGLYTDNTVHSTYDHAVTFYNVNGGVQPKVFWDVNQTTADEWTWNMTSGYMYNFLVYKSRKEGFFMHAANNLFLVNVTVADTDLAINLMSNRNGGVIGGRFLAASNNLGNPGNCTTDPWWFAQCAPTVGCTLSADPSTWRARMQAHWLNPMFGVAISGPKSIDGPDYTYTVTNLRFSGYEQQCGRVSAAFSTGLYGELLYWSASQAVSKIQASSPNMPLYWFANQYFQFPNFLSTNAPLGYNEGYDNFAVWDPDGSVVGGSGGYLVANVSGLPPPASKVTCTPLPQQNAIACPGTCYRTLRFDYWEDGFGNATGIKDREDYTYLIVRRVEDNLVRTFDGNLNDFRQWGDRRVYWVNLYAPATYEVTVGQPTSGKSPFWPKTIYISTLDYGGCGADVNLRFTPSPGNQWTFVSSDFVYWRSCPGSTFTGNSKRVPYQFQYVCNGGQEALQLTVTPYYSKNFAPAIFTSGQPPKACGLPQVCGVCTSSDWYFYETSGRDLRSPGPGYMGFAVPSYDDLAWLYGKGVIGNTNLALAPATLTPFWGPNLGFVHYFRKSFTITNSGCYSGILLDFIPQAGHVVYLNNVEVYRWNMPNGTVTNTTLAPIRSQWLPNPLYFTVLIDTAAASAFFVEGKNVIAVETHAPAPAVYMSGPLFDSRIALQSSSEDCKGVSITPEVCDGLDNDYDGLVDRDPITGKLLSRPCTTACGAGVETCINGAYQNCTATQLLLEICNGKDDNCDGLVDNGLANTQLDCASGSVCFQGQCLPQASAVAQTIVSRSDGGWYYQDAGWAWQASPNWTTGVVTNAFKPGAAPFGTPGYANMSTVLALRSTTSLYTFFLKGFQLSADVAASTYALQASVRRDSAAVVWANGVEIFRSNFPATWQPSTNVAAYAVQGGTSNTTFWPSLPLRSTGAAGNAVKAGVNWVAAQVGNLKGSTSANFDLELRRFSLPSCASLPGSPATCVRNPPVDTMILPFGSVWKYLDLNYSLPASSWPSPTFDDSLWPSGPGPLGTWGVTTRMNMNRAKRPAYYYRRTFALADAACYYSLTVQLKAMDGAVVYFNGVEAFRFQIPANAVISPTLYTGAPAQLQTSFTLPNNWLTPGNNTIAVATFAYAATTSGNFNFDMAVTGQREAVNCQPLPP